jgi:hypothetical protein
MKFIGTTETYDPVYVSDWESRLLDVNIIISKELDFNMMKKLSENKDKIIFHHTVTGYGSTKIEPGVHSYLNEFHQARELLDINGNFKFPISQYVLRIDPIIPWVPELILMTRNVLVNWSKLVEIHKDELPEGKMRCRVSIIDVYNHVRERFKSLGPDFEVPFNGFTAPKEYFRGVVYLLSEFKDYFEFEACAEPRLSRLTKSGNESWISPISCASYLDIETLGKNPDDYDFPAKRQRPTCLCLAKKQILGVKPSRCPHKCIYCYWKS